jgi:hypothetical protein
MLWEIKCEKFEFADAGVRSVGPEDVTLERVNYL